MRLFSPCYPHHCLQQGATAVEFAIVAVLFFVLLFGGMEFGRVMYVWNSAQEITRHAARLAAVTDFSDGAALLAVKQQALFGSDSLPGAVVINSENLQLRYLNAAGDLASPMPLSPTDNVSACQDALRVSECIVFVEASLCEGLACTPLQYQPMLGLFSVMNIDVPLSSFRLPVESLGFVPS